MKINKYLKKNKKNDIYDQLLDLGETLNDVTKMINIKISMDYLDMKKPQTKKLRKMIMDINLILNAFDKNVNIKMHK